MSRAISLDANNGEMVLGSTRHVQRRLAVAATDSQRSCEARPKEQHSCLHPAASTPDGPAAPCVRKAIDFMR